MNDGLATIKREGYIGDICPALQREFGEFLSKQDIPEWIVTPKNARRLMQATWDAALIAKASKNEKI